MGAPYVITGHEVSQGGRSDLRMFGGAVESVGVYREANFFLNLRKTKAGLLQIATAHPKPKGGLNDE